MIPRRQYQAILVMISLFLISNILWAQKKSKSLSWLNVNMIANEELIPLQEKVLNCFRKAIKENSITLTEYPKWELLLGVKEINKQQIAISITTLLTCPQEIINIAAENEAFYTVLKTKKELPKEGKSIRQYVTSEYMHQFKMVANNEIHIVYIDALPGFCRRYVDTFIKNSNQIKM